jgi:hypothetical protein
MEFDDLFENRQKHHGNYMKPKYHDEDRYSYDSNHAHYEHDKQLIWLKLLKNIWGNKKLKLVVIFGGILVLAVIIIIIIVLLPIIWKLFSYISQHGLQGLLDGMTAFLNKIWTGSAK